MSKHTVIAKQKAYGFGVVSFDSGGRWSVKFRDGHVVTSIDQTPGKDIREAEQRATAVYRTLSQLHKNP